MVYLRFSEILFQGATHKYVSAVRPGELASMEMTFGLFLFSFECGNRSFGRCENPSLALI